ncbi:MAG TPA: hypothetical protein VFQ44_24580 [Streptosporangiaceae bacterium]|nr:hypothetical protein [Streptosporangiaceae bacterium]
MRNAGDGVPGGSSGRRQRVTVPPETARPTGNGGASLFTPAYRVRHAAVPSQGSQDRLSVGSGNLRDGGGYSAAADPAGVRASWPDRASSGLDYAQVSADPGSAWADRDLPQTGYSWLTDDNGAWPSSSLPGRDYGRMLSKAIRGFPPMPDEPLPSYPPGPFAAWNRGSRERGEHRREAAGSVPAASGSWDAQPAARRESARGLTSAIITPDEFDTNHSLPAIKDPIPGTAATAVRTPGAGPKPADRNGRVQGTRAPSAGAPPGRAASGGRAPARQTRAGRRSRRRHQPVWMAIGVAVVIVAGFTAVLVTTSLGSKPSASQKPSSEPRPSHQPTLTPPAGIWEYIGARTTDKAPLTLPEIFPGSFVARHVYFHATALKQTHNCHSALIGTALQSAVRQAGCTQALRASYVARADNAMATMGVFNLATATAANKAARHAGRSQFVAQLTTKNGVTSKIGQGTGLEEALVKGHFLILVWAEKTDLTTPKTKWQRAHLTGFMNTLIAKTVNGSLSYRMVEGKPIPPSQNHH